MVVVLSYFRWLMMRKKEGMISNFPNKIPEMPDKVNCKEFILPEKLNYKKWSDQTTGSPFFFNDYSIGEEINHLDGQTIEEAEHQLATRLYQKNNARVHFNQHVEKDGRFGRRIIYGGYIISLARAISCKWFS